MTLASFRRGFERLLETIVLLLMVALAVVVTLAVVYRKFNAPFIWYDEVASILLAWITYYGSALAALKRAHIGVPGLVDSLPPNLRLAAALFGEACVIAFFLLLAYVGVSVMGVLATDYLVTLPSISVNYVQSAIPVGALLFVVAELLILPDVIAAARQAPGTGASAKVNP